MKKFEESIITLIESTYASLTSLEKRIADFFVENKEKVDLSSKNISKMLYVSEASLSRFSKKCGFSGYREFSYNYKKNFNKQHKVKDINIKSVLNIYQDILDKTYDLFDQSKINAVGKLLATKKRVFVYGKGSSGVSAIEFKIRFLRVGVNIDSVTDNHLMKMTSVIADSDTLVIGISISGKTKDTLSSLQLAKKRGACTVLITSNEHLENDKTIDEVVLVPLFHNIQNSNIISPQFPILLMTDLIYAHFVREEKSDSVAVYANTLNAIEKEIN